MNSVAQYMTPEELNTALAVVRRLLKPNGRLVLGDILRPEVGIARDVVALLKFAKTHGFLKDTLTASPAPRCRTTGSYAPASGCSATAE